MQKLGFPGLKSLDQLRPLSGPGAAKNFSFCSRPSQQSASSGSFVNLKLTAEKLVKEQTSAKTDLELTSSKLKKSEEHSRLLEEKLQNALIENAKLKVKQKEGEKRWHGLESKFSSTKSFCDQLAETLQHLASQVQDAEKDKKYFECKIAATSEAVDSLNQQMHDLSSKLAAAGDTIQNREKELTELKIERDERDKLYKDQQLRDANHLKKRDGMIRDFEVMLSEKESAIKDLNSKLEEMQRKLGSKEDDIQCLIAAKLKLEKERNDVQLNADELSRKLVCSQEKMEKLELFVYELVKELADLNEQNMDFFEKSVQLNSLYETSIQLLQAEKELAAERAEKSFCQLHNKLLSLASERDALQSAVKELEGKILELEKAREPVMTQLADECRLAREKIQKLESETEFLVAKRTEAESIASKLKDQLESISENLRSSEERKEQLLLKLSASETANKGKTESMQAIIEKKDEDIGALKREWENLKLQFDSQEAKMRHFQNILEEKDQLIQQHVENEKKLEESIKENQAKMAVELGEAKRQYDLMLESKQSELSRHLKQLSITNDQAIDEIRRKYEEEKQRAAKAESEKVEKVVEEMKKKLDKELVDCKEESRQQLMRIQEEHAAQVRQIQEEHERKELVLKARHDEELKRTKIHAENELSQENSISSIKMRNPHSAVGKRNQPQPMIQTPASKLIKRVENADIGSAKDLRRHKKRGTPTTNIRKISVKAIQKFTGPRRSSNIGDLFSDGTLNPYKDDPFAFDPKLSVQ